MVKPSRATLPLLVFLEGALGTPILTSEQGAHVKAEPRVRR